MSCSDRLSLYLSDATIDCPDCSHIGGDDYDQYTCTTCMCQGGEGKINIFDAIKEQQNAELLPLLRPFVAIAEKLENLNGNGVRNDDQKVWGVDGAWLTLGDFRAIAKAGGV